MKKERLKPLNSQPKIDETFKKLRADTKKSPETRNKLWAEEPDLKAIQGLFSLVEKEKSEEWLTDALLKMELARTKVCQKYFPEPTSSEEEASMVGKVRARMIAEEDEEGRMVQEIRAVSEMQKARDKASAPDSPPPT